MFTLRQFCFDYPKRPVLKNINMDIAEGDYVGLIGPNGSGKSTLLKCLAGVLKAKSGTLSIAGQNAESLTSKAWAKQTAFVEQNDDGLFPFPVRDFVLMGRYPHLSPFTPLGLADYKAADEAMEQAGVPDLSQRLVSELSGGERRRVLIAAALAQESRVLLLDEPEAFLDPPHAMEVRSLLKRLNQEKKMTLIVATHDLESALEDSTKVIALKAGELAFIDTPEGVASNGHIDHLFNYEFEKIPRSGNRVPLLRPKAL